MRFAGDLVRDRFGGVRTLRICTLFAIAGMLLAGFAPNAEIAILGFALCGIGISNMVPIAFSAAGNIPGLKAGIGLSVVTTMGYSGMLVAPSAIGFVAEHVGFSVDLHCTAGASPRRSGALQPGALRRRHFGWRSLRLRRQSDGCAG
jgi:MFS family permease